jgi:hypothetical protein
MGSAKKEGEAEEDGLITRYRQKEWSEGLGRSNRHVTTQYRAVREVLPNNVTREPWGT